MTLDAKRELASNCILFRHLEQLITELPIAPHDFVIFGSAPLLAHGLRDKIYDLDIVARGSSWERAQSQGSPTIGSINGAPIAAFFNGRIQFSEGWISGEWDADELIDHAETIGGFPFASLAEVFRYKQKLQRPKDLSDIKRLLAVLPSLGEYSAVSFHDEASHAREHPVDSLLTLEDSAQ